MRARRASVSFACVPAEVGTECTCSTNPSTSRSSFRNSESFSHAGSTVITNEWAERLVSGRAATFYNSRDFSGRNRNRVGTLPDLHRESARRLEVASQDRQSPARARRRNEMTGKRRNPEGERAMSAFPFRGVPVDRRPGDLRFFSGKIDFRAENHDAIHPSIGFAKRLHHSWSPLPLPEITSLFQRAGNRLLSSIASCESDCRDASKSS